MFAKNSKRIAYGTTFLVSFVLCLVCVIGILLPNKTYEHSGEYSFVPGVSANGTVIYEGISLKPGVYYVEMEYTADALGSGYCTLTDGTVFSGGLLTNGEHLYPNLERTGFHMWLFESTDHLQVNVSYGGNGTLDIRGIRFTETNGLWTMLLTVTMFGFGVAMLLLHYHYNLSKRLSKGQKTVIWGVFLITLLASYFPLTGAGLSSIDITYHYMRIEGVKDGILSGQIPTRIEPEWLFGQGFACGIFYCNLFLLIPALLRLLGFTVVASSNIFFILTNLATAIIAYYCFKKIFDNMQIGLVCSALYTLSVFRVYKLYITGDVGEGLAYTFFPLILYGYYRVFTEDNKSKEYKTAWIPLMLGYGGLMQSHILTCIIVGFLTIVLCLICIRKIFKLPTFLELAKGALGAIGISLWYLVPFLDYYLTQDVHIKNLTARTIQFRGLLPAQLLFHFWRDGETTPMGDNGMQYSYPVGAGLVLLVGLAVFLLIWFNGFKKVESEKAKIKYGITVSMLAVLMLLMSLSIFPWDRLQGLSEVTAPLISSLEFPSRVMGAATALLIIPFGFCMWYFEKIGHKKGYWGSVLVMLIGITTSTLFMCDNVYVEGDTFSVYNEEGMGFGFVSDGEYLMEGTPLSELTFEVPVYPENVVLHQYDKEYLTVNMECENLAGVESYIDIPILNYRDYRAVLENGEELEITNNEKMQIRVLLPAGFRGNVEISFHSPLYWRISEIVSVCTALAFVVLSLRKSRERRGCHENATV